MAFTNDANATRQRVGGSCDTPLEAPCTSGRSSVAARKLFGSANKGARGSSFSERYKLGRILGSGSFSVVRLVTDRATGQELACKIVTEEAERALLLREVDLLQQLDHPNLLKYHEHFNEPDHLYIVTELLEGDELMQAVVERGSYSEDDAREIMRQLLSALSYLSSKGIAHRDLKLENVLLSNEADRTKIKIIDFGLSDQLSDTKPVFKEACGSPAYLAPEVVKRLPYGTSCDVWAAGVVLFVLLSGDYPFKGRSVGEIVKIIERASLEFQDPVWEITTAGAKDFVSTLLTADPAARPTAEAALNHPWLSDV